MNSGTKIGLVVCLTISICAGSFPFYFKNFEVNALDGGFLSPFGLLGNLKCEVSGQSRPTELETTFQSGPDTFGEIIFKGPLPKRTETKWEADSVNIESGRSSFHVSIKASLLSLDNFVRTCIGSSDPKLTMVGDVRDTCARNLGTGTFNIEAKTGSVVQLTGSFSGDMQCDIGGLGGPPPNGGSCTVGTDKNDNLIGTSKDDCIDGKGGNDKIAGLVGNDKLNGGDGKDLLSGSTGNDELTGGKGADKFDCGAGKDKITDFNPSEGDIKSTNCE